MSLGKSYKIWGKVLEFCEIQEWMKSLDLIYIDTQSKNGAKKRTIFKKNNLFWLTFLNFITKSPLTLNNAINYISKKELGLVVCIQNKVTLQLWKDSSTIY